MSIEQQLYEDAVRYGFDAVGITRPEAIAQAAQHLSEFVELGRHGEMTWLADTVDRRANPHNLWPDCRSAILLAISYAPHNDPLRRLRDRDRGVIAAYAKGRDYHDVIKGRLKQIAGRLASRANADVKVFVDTAPLLEKPLAATAGIGWQGKHTNLVSREHGSWLLLGAILTTAELQPSSPTEDHCGSCRRCLDVCPTDAFPAPYKLDARRCISYLTIEFAGTIPRMFRSAIANRIFGCDDCLAVCPWNKFASVARETKLRAQAQTDDPDLAELAKLDDKAFRKRFAGTPIKRTGRDRLARNVLIAIGNSGDKRLLPAAAANLNDRSPLVRAMAVWAIARLMDGHEFAALALECAATETDPLVRDEWQWAMAQARQRP